jgi:hypothetical protein
MSAFCREPMVCRATRVAALFTTASANGSRLTMNGLRLTVTGRSPTA